MDPTSSPRPFDFSNPAPSDFPPPPPPFDDVPEPPPMCLPAPTVVIQEPRSDDDEEPEAEATDAYSQVLKHRTTFPGVAVGGVPSAISRMAEEISRVEQVSLEFASVCCLGAVSAAAGRFVRLKGLSGRTSRANLYLLISARSTSGKTTVFNHAFKAIRDLEADLFEDWLKTKKPGLEADLTIAKGELKRLDKEIAKGKPGANVKNQISNQKAKIAELEEKLAPPCLVSEDFTSEALGIRLKHSGEVLTIISSDARKFLQNLLGRNTSNNETDENLLLKGWSGDPDTQIRVSRSSVSLREPCLSATLAIQDDKFEEIFTNKAITESGLAARFLSVRVAPTKRTYSVNASGIGTRVANDYDKSICSIARAFLVPHEGSPVDALISMTSEARQVYCDYSQECENLAHGELQGVEMYVRRWAENAHRIALCLHLSQHEAKAKDLPVSEEAMRHAIAIQRWFNAHQLQAVRGDWDRKRMKRRDKLAAILQTQSEAHLPIRDLRRSHGYDEEELNELVKEFPEHFMFDDIKPGVGGGRSSRVVKYIHGVLLAF